MIKIIKNKKQEKNKIFLKSLIGSINIYLIDKELKIPTNVQVILKNDQIIFKGSLGTLNLKLINNVSIINIKNKFYIYLNIQQNISLNQKKSILCLYNKLIQSKIKGILQGYKLNLFLKGIGYKALIENNVLNLKLGFSHNILINIPSNIKIISQKNQLIFSSIDWIFLTQFVNFIKNYKKPEPYKGKGFLFKNENIVLKKGKKSKK